MPRIDRRAFLFLSALFAPAFRLRAAAAPGRDAFLRVSERLLERTGLDAQLAGTYRAALLETPANVALLAQLAKGAARTEPERALEATIVEWWHTGVYVKDGTPRLATHTGALMWSALGMPAPGSCASAFGAWSRSPQITKKA